MTSQQVILDTDWYTDVDDVMALRVLLRLQQYNHLKLLGVCLNASFEESVRSVDAFLLAHGVDVPVGIIQNWEKDFSGRNGPSYQKYLAQLPSKYKGNSDAEAPVKLYRRLLATSPEKVTLFSIGFTENYAELLESPPDEFSPLTGMELARKKVEKLFMMAGFWPRGSEYNLTGGSPVNPIVTRAGSIVLANWPTPITFLGFEVGNTVLAGDFYTLWGRAEMEDILCGSRFSIAPQAFFQVNPPQAEKLYRRALAYAAPGPADLVFDLYCGAGGRARDRRRDHTGGGGKRESQRRGQRDRKR